MKLLNFLPVICSLSLFFLVYGERCTVYLAQGKYEGMTSYDVKNGIFCKFLSIPYAAPPVGNLRFADPKPPAHFLWKRTLLAKTDVPSCPQIKNNTVIGQEDCLYLNVYTPQLYWRGMTTKPVIVFIHGGGFNEGSASQELYGPEFLMVANVVLVTVNYRLGLLGFLSSSDPSAHVQGNMGLKDQLKALEWVKNNIIKFGGDPSCVTLMGHGSGGIAANAHMFTKARSSKLFHRVIAMSGVVANQYGRGVFSFDKVARKLGVRRETRAESLAAMRNISFEEIVEAQDNQGIIIPINAQIEASPVVTVPTKDSFFRVENRNFFRRYPNMPLLMGYTNLEGMFAQVVTRMETGEAFVINDMDSVIPYNINVTFQEREQLKKEIRSFYFRNDTTSMTNIDATINLVTDAYFIAGMAKELQDIFEFRVNPSIWLYRFSGDTKLNFAKQLVPETSDMPGASHMDDLGYIFKTNYTPSGLAMNSKEMQVVRRMVYIIKVFAQHGVPPVSLRWLPVKNHRLSYLSIENSRSVSYKNPDGKRWEFWTSIYQRYGKNARMIMQKR